MSESESASNDGTVASGGRRRAATLAVVALATLAAVIWGWGRWRYARSHVSSENAQVDAHIVPVLAKVGGYVEKVLVDENQAVQRGETLVVLDDSELRVRLAEAEAALEAARAAAGTEGVPGQVEADATAARARREALEARLESARAERERALSDLARVEELAGKRIASVQQLDAARASAEAADAEVAALQGEVAAAEAAEIAARAAVRAADARLAGAEAGVQRAALDLSYAHVPAPASGVASRVEVEVGQLVRPGQPLGAVVIDSAPWITANLKETETAGVREGQSVEIDVDAYPGCVARGAVGSLSPATGSKFALIPPDNATGNFTKVVQRVPVRIAVSEGCGPERPLRPGMSVVVHIDVG